MAEVYKPADTRTALVTSYQIKSSLTGALIGKLQDINPSESRNASEVWEIGIPQTRAVPSELVPGLVKGKTFKSDRIALYGQNVMQAYGFDAITLVEAEEKFNVEEYRYNKTQGAHLLYKTYVDCIITSYSETKQITGDIWVAESVTIAYRDVLKGIQYKNEQSEFKGKQSK